MTAGKPKPYGSRNKPSFSSRITGSRLSIFLFVILAAISPIFLSFSLPKEIVLRNILPDQPINTHPKTLAFSPESNFFQNDTLFKHIKTSETEQSNEAFVNQLIELYQNQGFLDVRLDSVRPIENDSIFWLATGKEYQFMLYFQESQKQKIALMDLSAYLYPNPISFAEKIIFQDKVLDHYSNTGFPFARIETQTWKTDANIIHKTIEVNEMDLIRYDTIRIEGNAQISRRFLENHLNIKAGGIYNEHRIQNLSQNLDELEFLELQDAIAIRFIHSQARIILPLDEARANRFDGMAGLSSLNQTETGSNLQFTGYLNLHLINAYGAGEQLRIRWRAPGNQTQILHTFISIPYPLNFPLRSEFDFSIHRQDTSWIQLTQKPLLQFRLQRNLKMSLFTEFEQNNLISTQNINLTNFQNTALDYQSVQYGLGLHWHTPGFHIRLLRAGYSVEAIGSAGNRRIIRNLNLPPDLYNHIEMSTFNARLGLNAQKRFRISPGATFDISFSAFHLMSENIPFNQLVLLGGFNSIRGFDENALTASSYIWSNMEYRYFLAERNYLSLFINGGWLESKSIQAYTNDIPLGLGSGIHIETPAGVLALYFALGMQKDIPFNSRNAKIHFGYTVVF